MLKLGVQKNKAKFYPSPVYIGYVTVLTDSGKYLYTKYSPITALNEIDALENAKMLVNENGTIG